MKMKESEKMNDLDLARELKKKLCNMKTTVMPIVVSTLGMVHKVFEKRLGNWKSEKESRLSRPQQC